MIDLHSHSTASDGQYPAAVVAARAAEAGLTVWSLSDHDTVAGLAEARAEAERRGLRFVPGIELSAFLDDREVHVLGHFIDPADAALAGLQGKLGAQRRTRMEEMIAKLGGLGIRVTMAEVERFSGGKNLGRPHLARALVEQNVVADVKEAFDRFLGNGKPAYAERYKLSASEAIGLIRGAGGAATLAHPGVSKMEKHDIGRLARLGLSGVEVHHTDHNPSVREKYLTVCDELDLVPTAGTDFHGEAVTPDRLFGKVTMAAEDLLRLEARRGR